MSTAAMRDLRARDPRFPPKTGQGYSVFALAHLLRARELERQSDEDFNALLREGARDALRDIEAGRWSDFPSDFVARLAEYDRATLRGERDVDPATGRTAREESLADALDALRAAVDFARRNPPA
jgi:hypothetical protein